MRMNILPNTEALFIQRTDNRCYEISMVYKIGTETAWKTEKYAYWNMSGGFQKNTNINEVIAVRRRDLEGYEIKICYVLTDNDSIHHLSDEVNDHIDTITKVNFPSTNHLLDFLNAERKYVFVNTWGYRINGTWNGLTGFLVNGDVEIGGSPMFFTAERTAVVDFISSPTPTRSKFVFQQPKLSYENNLFLLSFRTAVWYSTLALISLIFTMLLAVTAWEWKKMSQIKTRDIDAGVLRPSVTDVTMLVFGATCQQGSTVELKGSLGRVVMLILFLTLMFLYTSYSANIVALLQSSSSQIKTLEDLLHSRLKFGVHDTVFNRYYFSTADEPVRKAIYEKKIAPPGVAPQFMSMEEGVKKMRKGLFAFHMETGVGYKFVGKYFKESEKCGLKEIQYLQVIDPWLAVRKNTPYKEMFKIGISTQSEWITEDYGNWTAEHGLIMSNIISSDASRRRNIRGHPVTTSIIVTENRTKSELDDLKNLLSDSLAKICFRHTKNLCQFMNASHKIGFASMWGYKTNGTWNGMMGDLAKGTVDFGGTIAFLTSQRLQVVDYLSSPVPINAKFVFREPPLSYQNNLFLLPYKANVWYCTAAFVVLLVIILYINAKWEIKKAEYEQAGINKTALQPSVSDVTILVISAISQQGSSNELKGTLGRAVLFLLFLTFLFLYISYSANIVALLQSNSKQIRTLQDLLNSKLELGVEDIVYNRYYFSTATEPIRKAIYETKVAPKGSKANFMSIEEGVKKLQKSPFAFNMNIGTGYKIIERYFEEHEKCGLQEINYIESSIPWMSCRKNSPFREIYKLGLFKLQEHGITDRENRLLFARKPVCIVRGGNVGSVNMVDVYPVILMFLYGLFLAFLILLVEIVVHRKLSKVIVV
ncbi:uncharacterized protein LOC101739820 [Bombyx mori]|uniref:uncharacterized protein LOC101739820 n=1 Tax=Bombyx mori TaxID=7091 RepID=UPI002ED07FE7